MNTSMATLTERRAEFVDNPTVLHKRRIMGVDFAQGYLLHLLDDG